MYYISPKGYYYQVYKNGTKNRISEEKYYKKINKKGGSCISNPKIALITMSKNPEDFDIWLNYHLNVIKFDHIFLRIENTPNLKHIINKYPNVSTMYINDNIDNRNSYYDQMNRQHEFIDTSIKNCLTKNIDYIVHIDDDELFMLSNKYTNIQHLFKTIDSKYECIHFNNVEAIFPNNKKNCFDTTKFLNCSHGKCKSYANGKSSGKVSQTLKPLGVHLFHGATYNVNINEAVILHFDSCSYNKWFDKFTNLSNINNDKFNNIPFPFYKNSIKLLQKNIKYNDNESKKLYESYKIEPYYNELDFLEYHPKIQ